jgi:hypothetical protein
MDYLTVECPGDTPPCSLSGLVHLTHMAIHALGLVRATIDGFSDCRALPESAAAGLERLEAIAHGRHVGKAQQSDWYRRLRRIGPTLMGIELDLETDDSRLAAETFGPYSIHAEFVDARGLCVLVLHDSGREVTVTVADCHDKVTIEGLLAGVGATPGTRSQVPTTLPDNCEIV